MSSLESVSKMDEAGGEGLPNTFEGGFPPVSMSEIEADMQNPAIAEQILGSLEKAE